MTSTYLKKLWTDSDEIFHADKYYAEEQVVQI